MRSRKRKPFLKTKKAAVLGLLAVGLLSFGTTWAYYTGDDVSMGNPFTTASSGVVMVEEFDSGSSFLPGETVPKIVSFKNTGDMDLLLRVEVRPDEAWYSGDTETDLDTEYVIKNWSDNWAVSVDADGNKIPFAMDTDDDYMTDSDGTDLWSPVFEDGKGTKYRYYKKVLFKKGSTEGKDYTDEILESITLSTEVSNDRHAVDYSDKIYKLIFNAQAIPVEESTQEGALTEWGMKAVVSGEDVSWSVPTTSTTP